MSSNISEDIKPSTNEKFSSKEKDILEKNKKFFSTNGKYVNMMLKIINGESNISIRVLDWFVANYSKKNNIYYKIKINDKTDFFYVNNEYKNQLNGYSKRYFDPFCRKKKVIYSYHKKSGSKMNDIAFKSSIGQLNFFQWAIRNQVVKYVNLHLKEIEKDMKESYKINKKIKMEQFQINSDDDDEYLDQWNDEPDPLICSSKTINSLHISSSKKTSTTKSDTQSKKKRQKLSKSVYDHGIKKSNITIKLDFD